MMWAANGSPNNTVSYTGIGNDYGVLTSALGGNLTTSVSNVYNSADFNLDGTVRYSGINNDFLILSTHVLSGVLTGGNINAHQ